MKNKVLAITIMALMLFSVQTKAQLDSLRLGAPNPEYKSTICLNAGLSLVGGIINVAGGTGRNTTSYSVPAIQLTYDHLVEDWFSLGVGLSFQKMGIRYKNYTYFDEEGVLRQEDFSTDVTRINFGIRPLVHYGMRGKMDMYSGLRLGITNWTVKHNSSDPLYNPENDVSFTTGLVFSPQLILFGLRGYFTDRIGANFELAVGAPHFFSFGLNYRFDVGKEAMQRVE